MPVSQTKIRGLLAAVCAVLVVLGVVTSSASAAFFRDSNGVLNLVGSDASEYVIVSHPASGPVIAATKTLGAPEVTAASLVGTGCSFQNGIDDTTFAYVIACAANEQQMVLDLGGGNDQFTAGPYLTPLPATPITVLSVQLTWYGDVCRDSNPFAPSAFSLRIKGGEGNDLIRGGPGPDVIDGGPGNDRISPGLGDDVVIGGAGFDQATYCDRAGPVSLSLDGQANDGAPGERDDIGTGVEDLVGGNGDDRLVGDAGPTGLFGQNGNDYIAGLGGRDTLVGSAGDDQLEARDGNPERVDCGAGDGDRATVDASDQYAACETVGLPPELVLDADGDGSPRPFDCNDSRPDVRPGRVDTPDDGVDQNCDGHDAVNLDRDGDGSSRPADCNDSVRAIHPGAKERPGNDVDEDCDGIAQQFPHVAATISHAFDPAPAGRTLVNLAVDALTPGTTVAVTCRAHGCRKRLVRHIRHGVRALALTGILGRPVFRPGDKLVVCVTKSAALGKQVSFAFRSGREPASRVRVLQPSTTTVTGRCA